MPKRPLKRRCAITGAEYQHGSFSHIVHLFLHTPSKLEDRVLPFLFRSLPDLFHWFSGLVNEFVVHTNSALAAGPFVPVIQRFEQKWLKVGVISQSIIV